MRTERPTTPVSRRASAALGPMLATLLLASACSGGSTEPSAPTPATSPDVSETATPTTEPLTEPTARGYHRVVDVDGDPGVLLLSGQRLPGFPDPTTMAPDAAWSFTVDGGWVDLGLLALEDLPDFSEAAYDTESQRVVLYTDPTYTYDPATNRVEQMAPLGPSWVEAKLAYDSESDRIILFGELGETWSYDVDTDTWTQMNPKVSPPARKFHEMVYDPSADRVIAFGGFGAGDKLLGDTWSYDFNTDTWTRLSRGGGPEPRAYFAMAYDPTSDRTILFGGAHGEFLNEDTFDDTWAFDAKTNTWTELEPPSAPSRRGWHAMAYEPDEKVIVLFGGGPLRQEYTAETWIYDPAANTWSQVA